MKNNVLKKIKQAVKALFIRVKNIDLYNERDRAIYVVQQIKKFVNSDVVDVVIRITPTKQDDNAQVLINRYLELMITALAKFKKFKDEGSLALRMECVVKELKNMDESKRNELYFKMASFHTDEKQLVEQRYQELKKNNLI